jgi:hypothetical protein
VTIDDGTLPGFLSEIFPIKVRYSGLPSASIPPLHFSAEPRPSSQPG